MKRTLIALALASLFTTPVLAGSSTTSGQTTCRNLPGVGAVCSTSTTTTDSEPSRPLTKNEKLDMLSELRERDERIAEWTDFCKPKGTVDQYGVTRLAYAHVGCEYGRRK